MGSRGSLSLINTALNQSVRYVLRPSETNSIEGDVEKEGHSLDIIQTYCSWNNRQGASDNNLQSDSQTAVQHLSGSLPSQPSRTSQENQWQKEPETALKRHVIWKLKKSKRIRSLALCPEQGLVLPLLAHLWTRKIREAQG